MVGFLRRAALSVNVENGFLHFSCLSFSEQWKLTVKMLCPFPERPFCAHGEGNIAAAGGEELHLRHGITLTPRMLFLRSVPIQRRTQVLHAHPLAAVEHHVQHIVLLRRAVFLCGQTFAHCFNHDLHHESINTV